MLFSRPLISPDMRDWIETFFDWSEALFTAPQSPIVPTREFFSATKGRKDETANMVLRDVLRLSYIDADIKLMPLDVLPTNCGWTTKPRRLSRARFKKPKMEC